MSNERISRREFSFLPSFVRWIFIRGTESKFDERDRTEWKGIFISFSKISVKLSLLFRINSRVNIQLFDRRCLAVRIIIILSEFPDRIKKGRFEMESKWISQIYPIR